MRRKNNYNALSRFLTKAIFKDRFLVTVDYKYNHQIFISGGYLQILFSI